MLRSALLALVASASFVPAFAADLSQRKTAPATPPALSACTESDSIPIDAFGFTTGSEVADPGSFGASLSYGGGFGVRDAGRPRTACNCRAPTASSPAPKSAPICWEATPTRPSPA